MSDNRDPTPALNDARHQYRAAIDALRQGGVVALPTDTVYGLCAVAADDAAVQRLYEVKRRPADQPLPLFVAGLGQAALIADLNDTARALAERFWPGALTIVVPKKRSYRTRAAAGAETIGLRAPADPVLREIAAQLGPITGTSANLSGQPECRTAADVRAQLGDAVDAVVDAPLAADQPPSTVVDCTDERAVRILREGAVTRAQIAAALPAGTHLA